MPKIHANNLHIEYEFFGDPAHPTVMLVMGLGMQLVGWPDDFCQDLANSGYRVLRFDNRDIGLSSHLDHLGKPNLIWGLLKRRIGLPIRAPYSLADMAQDAVALLDALQIEQAHVVGASMGGMIAQLVAGIAPQKVLTLTSIMSSSGAPGLPGPTPRAQAALLKRPPKGSYHPAQRDRLVEHYLNNSRVIHSPAFPMSEDARRARIRRGLDRSIHPEGVLRQLLAIAQGPDRSPILQQIRQPTLVIHGKQDPLVPIACGRDTASKIPGARLVEIDGMGHDLPPGVCQLLVDALVPHFRSVR